MLYKNIRDLREDSDLTQQKIANFLNIDRTVYSRYETGSLQIPPMTLSKLADFYNTSTDYLLR